MDKSLGRLKIGWLLNLKAVLFGVSLFHIVNCGKL